MTNMPRGCPNIYLRTVSYVALFLTLCIAVVALCTSNWCSYKQQKEVKLYIGLWNVCHKKADFGRNCTFLPRVSRSSEKMNFEENNSIVDSTSIYAQLNQDMLTAVRVLYSMGILLLLGAILYPPAFKQMTSDVIKIEVMAVFTAAGGVCLFLAMLMMTHQINSLSEPPMFGYSFLLGWTAMGMSLFSACLIYIASKGNVYIEKVY